LGDTLGHGTRDGLSVRAMAAAVEVLGHKLTKSQVQRDYHDGAPRQPGAYIEWRAAHRDVSRSAEGRIDRPQSPSPAGAPTSPPEDEDPSEPVDKHTEAYRADRALNESIKAQRAQLELNQLRGSLVSLRDVEQLQFTAGRITRDRVLMVPARLAANLHAQVLALLPDEHRDAVSKSLAPDAVEQLLEIELRAALDQAAKAIEEAGRDDEDPDD
jgi:hypothetical protein